MTTITIKTCGDNVNFSNNSENKLRLNNVKPSLWTKSRIYTCNKKSEFPELLDGISDFVAVTTPETEKKYIKKIESLGFETISIAHATYESMIYFKKVA